MRSTVRKTQWPSGIVTVWDYNLPEQSWACPFCGSSGVHLSSYKDGIICYRTDRCGFAPYIGEEGWSAVPVARNKEAS